MSDFWLPLFPFAIFFGWLFLFGMKRRKACPDCNEALPSMQSPFTKTKRQWVEGGSVCQNCGCEADSAGAKVSGGTPSGRPSSIAMIGLFVLLVVPFIAMFGFLFQG